MGFFSFFFQARRRSRRPTALSSRPGTSPHGRFRRLLCEGLEDRRLLSLLPTITSLSASNVFARLRPVGLSRGHRHRGSAQRPNDAHRRHRELPQREHDACHCAAHCRHRRMDYDLAGDLVNTNSVLPTAATA